MFRIGFSGKDRARDSSHGWVASFPRVLFHLEKSDTDNGNPSIPRYLGTYLAINIVTFIFFFVFLFFFFFLDVSDFFHCRPGSSSKAFIDSYHNQVVT